jgi:hypothetical protein
MKKYGLYFILFFLLKMPLMSASITNEELLKACTDPSPATQNFCYGFVISATNAAQFYRNIVDVEHEFLQICFPKNIANKEIVDIYIAWAEKNMTLAKSPAFVGVSSSFSTKFSCVPNKKPQSPAVYF